MSLFDEFCEQWLQPSESHKQEVNSGMQGESAYTLTVIGDFTYFLQVLKTVFFWKKVAF